MEGQEKKRTKLERKTTGQKKKKRDKERKTRDKAQKKSGGAKKNIAYIDEKRERGGKETTKPQKRITRPPAKDEQRDCKAKNCTKDGKEKKIRKILPHIPCYIYHRPVYIDHIPVCIYHYSLIYITDLFAYNTHQLHLPPYTDNECQHRPHGKHIVLRTIQFRR